MVIRITVHEIDETSHQEFAAQVEQAIDSDDDPVVLDFSDVTYADSTTLRVLISADAAIRKQGRTLQIVNRSPAMTRLLAVTGLAEHFDGA